MSKLMCYTRRHIVTKEGDFIPTGTPVQVLCWAGPRENQVSETVAVRTTAYMYDDSRPTDIHEWDGNVNHGLYVEVLPEDLIFLNYTA